MSTAREIEIGTGLMDAWDKAEREGNSVLCHVLKRTLERMDSDVLKQVSLLRHPPG